MDIVLIGPQGSGKGTQADLLASRFGLVKLSTGDLFRAEIESKTELGQQVEQTLAAGHLVSDNVTLALVADRLDQIDRSGVPGVIFDGFPRTRAQAEGLDQLLEERGRSVDAVIELVVPEEVLVDRLSGRRICKHCGTVFHVHFHPPAKEDVCDKCGGELYQRPDDEPEAIRKRLDSFWALTKPLLEFYESRGIVKLIDGDQNVKAVEQAIVEILDPIPVSQ